MTDDTYDDSIATPSGFLAPLASTAWLAARGIRVATDQAWQIEIVLSAPAARFELRIFNCGWGYLFRCGDRVTEIELTDAPSIKISDPHRLHAATPPLSCVGTFVRALERRYQIELPRQDAVIRCSIAGAEPLLRAWLAEL